MLLAGIWLDNIVYFLWIINTYALNMAAGMLDRIATTII